MALFLLPFVGRADAADPLPRLGIEPKETSVSGLSAGAYMAGQFQIAHAGIVKGAAIIAGGPYGCAESGASGWAFGAGAAALNLTKAVNVCMLGHARLWGYPSAKRLASKALALMDKGAAGPRADVVSDRLYIFSGTEDTFVVPSVVATTAEFYKTLGVPASNIRFVKKIAAGHGYVTLSAAAACGRNGKPYLVDCKYDQAGELLRHIYGRLAPRSGERRGGFLTFAQKPFVPESREAGLAETGVVYIPPGCRRGGCRVHIAFHGCDQDVAGSGRNFVEKSGLTLWADTNRLVVLFPQVARTATNLQACWDWWGYTGRDFLVRTAPQIAAVRAMLSRLAQKP